VETDKAKREDRIGQVHSVARTAYERIIEGSDSSELAWLLMNWVLLTNGMTSIPREQVSYLLAHPDNPERRGEDEPDAPDTPKEELRRQLTRPRRWELIDITRPFDIERLIDENPRVEEITDEILGLQHHIDILMRAAERDEIIRVTQEYKTQTQRLLDDYAEAYEHLSALKDQELKRKLEGSVEKMEEIIRQLV